MEAEKGSGRQAVFESVDGRQDAALTGRQDACRHRGICVIQANSHSEDRLAEAAGFRY